jgi:hypothetical protein
VVVEDDEEALAGGGVDDEVHRALRRGAPQRRVPAGGEIDAVRRGRAERLERERQPDRVEAEAPDLRHHVAVVAGPEAVDDVVARLEPEPVHTLQHDGAPVRVDDARAAGRERRDDRGAGGGGPGRHEGDGEGGEQDDGGEATHGKTVRRAGQA